MANVNGSGRGLAGLMGGLVVFLGVMGAASGVSASEAKGAARKSAAGGVVDPLGIVMGGRLPSDCVKMPKGYMYLCDVKKPHPDLPKSALVLPTQEGRVVRIGVVVPVQDFSSRGITLRAKVARLMEALIRKYGKPSKGGDVLREGSPWEEEENYMLSLTNKDRMVFWMWEDPAPGLETVILKVGNVTPGAANILVLWNAPGSDEVIDTYEQQNDSSL